MCSDLEKFSSALKLMESQSRFWVTSLNCCPLTQILKLRIANLPWCPSTQEKKNNYTCNEIHIFAARHHHNISHHGSYPLDTWSRYVTSVTWVTYHMRSWHQVQGQHYPGQGCHLAIDSALRKLRLNFPFQNFSITRLITICLQLGTASFIAPDHLPHSESDIHQEGRLPIKLNGTFCFPGWMTIGPVVLSLLAPSTCQAAHSFQSTRAGLTNSGKIPPSLSNWRGDLLLLKSWHFCWSCNQPLTSSLRCLFSASLSQNTNTDKKRGTWAELCGCIQILFGV